MFGFLFNKLIQIQKRDLFNGNLLALAFCSLNGYPSIVVKSISTSVKTKNPINRDSSFTVSYLINSCGLSQEKALSASKKVCFKTSTKPDLVLTLFRNYGFTNAQISKLIEKFPQLLANKFDKTLKPKLDFFQSLGLSGPDLVKCLCRNPHILRGSLENQIIPIIAFIKSILHTDTRVVFLLKKSTWILCSSKPEKQVVPKLEFLRAQGVPEFRISSLFARQPKAFLLSIKRFKEIVADLKNMDFDTSKNGFVQAMEVLSRLSDSRRELKWSIYKTWGWSEDGIRRSFRLQPNILAISDTMISSKMDFFVNKMGYDPLLLSKNPTILTYSMEKRVIPRCLVMKILISNGLVKKDFNIVSVLNISDKNFLDKFVTRFEKRLPEVLNAYQREMSGL